MKKLCVIRLTLEERERLHDLVHKGRVAAYKRRNAQLLLWADESEDGPGFPDREVAVRVGVTCQTVENVRRRLLGPARGERALDLAPVGRGADDAPHRGLGVARDGAPGFKKTPSNPGGSACGAFRRSRTRPSCARWNGCAPDSLARVLARPLSTTSVVFETIRPLPNRNKAPTATRHRPGRWRAASIRPCDSRAARR